MFNNNTPKYIHNFESFNYKENSDSPSTELDMSDSAESLIGSPSPGARDRLPEVVRSSLVTDKKYNDNYYEYNYWGDDILIHPDNMATPVRFELTHALYLTNS